VLALSIRVPAAEAEGALDAILPALPGGAHVRQEGESTAITIYDLPGTPSEKELRGLLGSLQVDLTAAEASDDWRERRLERYEPLVVADRFLLRPSWAPPGEDPGLVEIVLEQAAAFGTGLHPTTQACLAELAECEPGGSFADFGCGSGVLSIAAAKLGWSPVVAVDVDEGSVAVAGRNAAASGVEVDARRLDLTADTPPAAETLVANVPPAIHLAVAERVEERPRQLFASGFHPEDISAVADAWEPLGLTPVDEIRAHDWVVLVLR
jgi:ribosomal protein L11 methyltransferase